MDNKDIYTFYNSILNLKSSDEKDIIKKIVEEEKEILLNSVSSLDGFCIYISSQIEERLKELGIKTYKIDLNELVNVNHIVLIAEYRFNENIIRLLIDPTFGQFKKEENKELIKLKYWPSDKLGDDNFVNELTQNGVFQIDDESFNKYINAFTEDKIYIYLDEYLINLKTDKIK